MMTDMDVLRRSVLIDVIDELIDAGVTDPGEIAEKVIANTPPEVIAPYIKNFLRRFALDRKGARRRANPLIVGAATDGSNHPSTRRQRAELGGTVSSADSPMARRMREAEAKRIAGLLADTVFTGSEHRPFGRMSFADLINAAKYARTQAGHLTARAERYERIAAVVKESGVSTVDELPLDVLTGLASGR